MPFIYLDYNSNYAYDAPVRYDGQIRVYGKTTIKTEDISGKDDIEKDVIVSSLTEDVTISKEIITDSTIPNLLVEVTDSFVEEKDVQ